MGKRKRMPVRFSKKFRRQYDKADQKIQSLFDKKLTTFLQNPFHPLLNNHALTGRLLGCRSINVTGDWRAIYQEDLDENGNQIVMFVLVGTHSQLYK